MPSTSPSRGISGAITCEMRPGRVDKQHDAVGHVDCLLDRVGDEDEGLLFDLAQPEQVLLELSPGLFVDGAERLVHQQHVGLDGQCTGEADSLAHAAGELVRILVLEAGEARPRRCSARAISLPFGLADAAQFQAEGDVAENALPRHQREVLEHKGTLRARANDRPTVHQHLTGGGRKQTRNDLEKRCLAAT